MWRKWDAIPNLKKRSTSQDMFLSHNFLIQPFYSFLIMQILKNKGFGYYRVFSIQMTQISLKNGTKILVLSWLIQWLWTFLFQLLNLWYFISMFFSKDSEIEDALRAGLRQKISDSILIFTQDLNIKFTTNIREF